jgi:hypothetical protein
VSAATPLPKIKVNSQGLYNSVTGKAFTPRGTNYVRLAETPAGATYHSTFEPGQYNLEKVRAFLTQMQSDKYNTVRVFIDNGTFVAPDHGISENVNSTKPIHGPYIDNVASFVKEAEQRGIYVLPVMHAIPANIYYYQIAGQPAANISDNNILYMDPGYIKAKEEYMKQFAAAMVQRLGNTNAILAYASDNEVAFDASKAPFDKMSGTVTPVDGVTYDMSKLSDRQQAADASLVQYTVNMKRGLLAGDQGALYTMGFFTNRAVGKQAFDGFTQYCSTACSPGVDYRVPGRPLVVSMYGAVDFIGLHMYPTNASGYTPKSDLETSEASQLKKPYIIGEFGAIKSMYNNNITKAATAMRDTQIATCKIGAKGWLFWAWDTYEKIGEQPLFFMQTEKNGAINGMLAPKVRPNACQK